MFISPTVSFRAGAGTDLGPALRARRPGTSGPYGRPGGVFEWVRVLQAYLADSGRGGRIREAVNAGAKVPPAMAACPYRLGLRRRNCSVVNVPGTTTRTAAAAGRAEMQEQVIDLLRTVARSLRRQHARLAANGDFPLSGPSLALLQEIAGHPGLTVSELARLTGLPKSWVSVLTARLVTERAVRKDPDQHDNRLVLLTITPEGHRRAAEWSAASRQAIGRLLRPLRDDELAAIASGLTALHRALQQAEGEPAGGAPSC